jgi:N-acetyltransferase
MDLVTLSGEAVSLVPLSLEHHAQLAKAVADPAVGRWMTTPLATGPNMLLFIQEALRARDQGVALPFATVERSTGLVIGSTRFGNIDRNHRRVEIGWTFIAPEWQRTRINTEAKYLMLEYAFERLGCIRVEFKTDSLNEVSRRAVLRVGARQEGIFRSHMIVTGGRIRDTVYFSIIEPEWPAVKKELERKLARQ